MKRLVVLLSLAPSLAYAQTINPGPPQVLVAGLAGTCCGGATTETLIGSIRVPGNSMGPLGAVDLKCEYTFPNSANNKTFSARFGTSSGVTGTSLSATVQTTQATGSLNWIVRNTGTTNSQVSHNVAPATPFGFTTNAVISSAIDTTADAFLNITATTASGAETITLNNCVALIMRAP